MVPTLHAWGPAGHKIVASIAFRQLSPEKKKKIVALLKNHPRFEEEFADKMPDNLKDQDAPEWIIQQAAIWPDMARGPPAGVRQQFHRGSWHFINVPCYLSDADEQTLKGGIKVNLSFDVPADAEAQKTMNVIQAIAHSRSIAMNPQADPSERALHVSWLIHLVGDLHQPLHSSALFSRKLFPDGDQGGNRIQTEESRNLHSLWDGFPGSPSLSTTRSKAVRLIHDEQLQGVGEAAAEVQDVTKWLDESHSLASTEAYNSEVLEFVRAWEQGSSDAEVPKLSLSEDYLKRGGEIANRRLLQAGYRLAKILDQIP
jgi:hypothetical protein